MPEGPSIVILREECASFTGRRIRGASGNSKVIDPARLVGQKVVAFRSWGKHFLVELSGGFTLRVHFMLFGRYRVNERREGWTPRLRLEFPNGELNLYACSVQWIEEPLDEVYDWSADVMSDAWSPRRARAKLKKAPSTLACDALLDQRVFSGVGNIIKNEVLFRIGVDPSSRIGKIPPRKLGQLIAQAREYSFDFLRWKKKFELKKHYQVYNRSVCPRCGDKVRRANAIGLSQRRTFWCARDQVLYR